MIAHDGMPFDDLLDAQLDGRRYTSCVKASRAGVDEALSWDDEDNETVVSLKLPPGAVTGDFDGSFSAEHAAHNLVSASAPTFAAEAGLAVADDERVRVGATPVRFGMPDGWSMMPWPWSRPVR
mgnify:CR=1 FL=1